MAKPQPIRIPSDDCIVTMGGDEWNVHEGESVTLFPIMSTAELKVFQRFTTLNQRMALAAGEADETIQVVTMLDETFSDACRILADRILAWDWTDLEGNPLPQPKRNPAVIESLSTEEMFYLITLVQGDNEAARKNDSRPSPTTGSDSAPVPIQKLSEKGRSRTKAS